MEKMTVADVARMLQVSQKTIYRWLAKGKIPAYKINDQYRFDRAELLQWAVAQKLNAPEELVEPRPPAAPANQPNLAEAIERGGVLYGLGSRSQSALLLEIANLLPLPMAVDRARLAGHFEARERLGSTGIGGGFAIPHSRQALIPGLTASSVTICFVEQPVAWGALDGQPVHTLFPLISCNLRDHVGLLSRLVFALRDEALRAALTAQAPREELFAHFRRVEKLQIQPGGAPAKA